MVAWAIFSDFVDPSYPLRVEDALIVNFFAELGFVSILLFRALDGRRTLRGCPGAGADAQRRLALALVVVGFVTRTAWSSAPTCTAIRSTRCWPSRSWLVMFVQSVAGLRALGGRRASDGTLVAG